MNAANDYSKEEMDYQVKMRRIEPAVPRTSKRREVPKFAKPVGHSGFHSRRNRRYGT